MRSYEQISGAKTMGFFRWEQDDDRAPRTVTKSRLKPMRCETPARSHSNVRAAQRLRLVWINPNIPTNRPVPPGQRHN